MTDKTKSMAQRATLSKKEIKKMFLKVLYEILFGNMKGYSNGIDSIVPHWINEYYSIKLSDEEIQLSQEAIQELKNTGLIVKDATQSDEVFQILTKKGKEIVEQMKDPDIYDLKLEEVLRNQELLQLCTDDFNDNDYETAIFKAFRFVEQKVREKARLAAKDVGTDLMAKAFNTSNGKLILPTCETPSEQEGIPSLFRGAISFFKNPSSHRTVNYDDRQTAIQILTFADLLLDILSKATLKT